MEGRRLRRPTRAGSETLKCGPLEVRDMSEDASPPEGEETATAGRTTAPQSPYGARDVALGALIAFAGLVVTFGVPLLLL